MNKKRKGLGSERGSLGNFVIWRVDEKGFVDTLMVEKQAPEDLAIGQVLGWGKCTLGCEKDEARIFPPQRILVQQKNFVAVVVVVVVVVGKEILVGREELWKRSG